MPSHSILLIDPFKNLLNAYRLILGEEQFQVDTTSNLKEAYDFFKKRKYSVIITEYIPPFETTDDFIQWVKENSPETHILIVTNATIDEKTYEKLFTIGVGDIILKPYSPEKILVHIKKGLKQRGLMLQMAEMKRLTLLEPIIEEIQGPVFNSLFFKRCLRQEIKKAKRHHHSFSLLLLEVPKKDDLGDRFANFYKELIRILRKHIREEDLMGKSNGEIGILLPETDQVGSQALVKRLSNLIYEYPSFRMDDVLRKSAKALFFQSFTYPNLFKLPQNLSSILDEINREFLQH